MEKMDAEVFSSGLRNGAGEALGLSDLDADYDLEDICQVNCATHIAPK